MILLNKLLEDGNTLYRKNRFDEAAHRYGYAIRRIPVSPANNNYTKDDKDTSSNEQVDKAVNVEDTNYGESVTSADDPIISISETFSQLKIHLLLNLSRCQRRLGKLYFLSNCFKLFVWRYVFTNF